MKNFFIFHKIIIVLLGFCLAIPLVTQAAQDNFRGNRQVVSYADLDLASNEGVVVLYQRLKHAAQSVCGNVDYGIGPRLLQLWQACVKQKLDQAVAGVNNKELTALHNQAVGPRVASNF